MDVRWITSIFHTVYLITVKAVKLASASILCKINFCNDVMYWDPESVLKTRPKELSSGTIWLKEFNVHIIIFYWNVVYNTKAPLIILRTSIKQSRHDMLNRQNLLLFDKEIFGNTCRHTVHNNVFSTWNKLMILASSLEGAAIWKWGLKEWNVFIMRLRVYINYVVTPVVSLFANSNNCLGVRICSEVSAS